MYKVIKYCFILFSSLMFLYVSSGNSYGFSPDRLNDSNSNSSPAQLSDSSINLICILPQNETTHSISQSVGKKIITKYLRSFHENNTLLKPKYSVYFQISENQQLAKTYHRQILFPFHFFL